jgi:glycosyltransferase involved in cell wall biosynthesis
MSALSRAKPVKLSVVIPCYNEELTLRTCVENVLAIADDGLELELIIVDDASTDRSRAVAEHLRAEHPQVTLLAHDRNRGKGAALRTGFQRASGDFVAVQDADLEYRPRDLKNLLVPLVNGEADVVLGSRFLSTGAHRVLYFWHYVGNRLLTLLSNMFTDLNLTDMETCYKVFRREIIQAIEIRENRFGFEPEIVAKVAHMRLRVFEMGISYYGRTYAEGKKIGVRDGIRALYCIIRYNAHKAPLPVQFVLYLFIGGASALVNLAAFLTALNGGLGIVPSASLAFIIAAAVNYFLCIALLFRHKARWSSLNEIAIFIITILMIGIIDISMTRILYELGNSAQTSKIIATMMGLCFNFLGRRYLVFYEKPSGPWQPQVK